MQRRHFLGLAAGSLAASQLRAAPVPKVKSDVSLIYVEDVETKKGNIETSRLMSLRVNEGEVGEPEEIASVKYGFFDEYGPRNMILSNRYVISGNGGVIDIKEKKVRHEPVESGTYKGIDNNRVIYRIGNSSRGNNGAYAFDPKEDKVEKLEKPGIWDSEGQISPDGKRLLTENVKLLTPDGKKTSLGFFSRQDGLAANIVLPIPALWIDNDTILAQVRNGDLALVDVNTKKQTTFETLKLPEVRAYGPALRRDVTGRIMYGLYDTVYLIDIKEKKAALMTEFWEQLGEQFEVMHSKMERAPDTIRYRGEKIGDGYQIETYSARTCAGHLAYVSRRLEEFRIWSTLTGKWSPFRMRINSIVGWVTN